MRIVIIDSSSGVDSPYNIASFLLHLLLWPFFRRAVSSPHCNPVLRCPRRAVKTVPKPIRHTPPAIDGPVNTRSGYISQKVQVETRSRAITDLNPPPSFGRRVDVVDPCSSRVLVFTIAASDRREIESPTRGGRRISRRSTSGGSRGLRMTI